MTTVSETWLDTIYGVTAFMTLFIGLLALSLDISLETIAPVVLLGATVTGMIGLYWLFGGEERRVE